MPSAAGRKTAVVLTEYGEPLPTGETVVPSLEEGGESKPRQDERERERKMGADGVVGGDGD